MIGRNPFNCLASKLDSNRIPFENTGTIPDLSVFGFAKIPYQKIHECNTTTRYMIKGAFRLEDREGLENALKMFPGTNQNSKQE